VRLQLLPEHPLAGLSTFTVSVYGWPTVPAAVVGTQEIRLAPLVVSSKEVA